MASIVYHQIGPRKWVQQVFVDQCEHKMVMPRGRCQGVKGHSGDHWMYGQSGSYVTSSNKKNLKPYDIAGGMCPPGHASYISPEEKISDYYITCNETSDVIDEDLIDKLENDEDMPDNVSVTRPISDEELDEITTSDGKTLRESVEAFTEAHHKSDEDDGGDYLDDDEDDDYSDGEDDYDDLDDDTYFFGREDTLEDDWDDDEDDEEDD